MTDALFSRKCVNMQSVCVTEKKKSQGVSFNCLVFLDFHPFLTSRSSSEEKMSQLVLLAPHCMKVMEVN